MRTPFIGPETKRIEQHDGDTGEGSTLCDQSVCLCGNNPRSDKARWQERQDCEKRVGVGDDGPGGIDVCDFGCAGGLGLRVEVRVSVCEVGGGVEDEITL